MGPSGPENGCGLQSTCASQNHAKNIIVFTRLLYVFKQLDNPHNIIKRIKTEGTPVCKFNRKFQEIIYKYQCQTENINATCNRHSELI